MTPRVILEYLAEGGAGQIVHAEQDGQTGYFQVVPEYDWVDDDPVWKGEHLEWLAADLEATARGIATLAAEAVGLLDGDIASHAISRRVVPRLDEGGRARERSRWEDALDVHMREEA